MEVKRAGSLSGNTRGGRGFGRGDRQGGERSRSARGRRLDLSNFGVHNVLDSELLLQALLEQTR